MKYVETFCKAESKGKATGLTSIGSVVSYKIIIGKTTLTGSNPINSVSDMLDMGFTQVGGKVGKQLWEAILTIPKVKFHVTRNSTRKDNESFHKSCETYKRSMKTTPAKKKATKKATKTSKPKPKKTPVKPEPVKPEPAKPTS